MRAVALRLAPGSRPGVKRARCPEDYAYVPVALRSIADRGVVIRRRTNGGSVLRANGRRGDPGEQVLSDRLKLPSGEIARLVDAGVVGVPGRQIGIAASNSRSS